MRHHAAHAESKRLLRSPWLVVASLLLVASLAFGQSNGGHDIQVHTHPELGDHLVDSDGRTIYAFAEDEPFTSTCVDECAEQWPPVTFDGIAPTSSGVSAVLVGSMVRADGTAQATFAGLPLYTYAGDTDEGSAKGSTVDAAWFPIAPDGSRIGGDAAAESEEEDAITGEALFTLGREAYNTYCAGCHLADGSGSIGPSLRANPRLANDQAIVRQIRDGMSEMPGFGRVLSNQELAAVATFVRGSWGNDYPPLTPEHFER
jgi:predicted lipoprotein with Yx(FWY)xxD motif